MPIYEINIKSWRMKSFLIEKILVFIVFLLCNLFFVPTESFDGSAVTGVSQLVRVVALATLVTAFWGMFFPEKIIVRTGALVVLLLFVGGMLISNFGSVRAGVALVFFPIAMALLCFLLFVLAESSAKFKSIFTSSLTWIVIFWVGSYLAQLALFIALGEILDVHNFFFPYSEQRTEVVVDGLVRLGGIHIEPGTFSNWLFGVLILRSILVGDVFDRINIVGFIGLPASLSVWGFIATVFVIAAYFLQKRRAISKGVVAILSLGIVLGTLEVSYGFVSDIQIYLESRSGVESSSTSTKYDAYSSFGSEAHKFVLVGQDVTYNFCESCWSIQDAGVSVNLATKIGIFFTIFIFALFGIGIYTCAGLSVLVLIIPMLWSKWFYWDPLFWLVVFFAFSCSYSEFKKERANV